MNKRNFPKGRRLLKHADFEKVYKHGRRHFSEHLTAFYIRREAALNEGHESGFRVGFTVSKALGGAVQRNRMKRRLREAARLSGFRIAPADVVINPKRTILTADFSDLQNEVNRAFDVIEKNLNKSGCS